MRSLSHLSFLQCEQVNFRPKKTVKIKLSHSVVAVGTAGVGVGKGRQHDMIFFRFFNLISLTISNKA